MSATREHVRWRQIKNRCYNPKDRAYKNYGGRGIGMCETWRNSFQAFYADVGPRPSPEMTLDRINNNGNYEPGNVRWATRSQQALNTRLTPAQRSEQSRVRALKRWHPELHLTIPSISKWPQKKTAVCPTRS